MAYHFLPGFRVKPTNTSSQNHWLGGPAQHKGAKCRACNRPLLLLWDIDCSDPRFQVRGRSIFKTLTRLPLYYCWTCAGEFDYLVTEPGRVRILKSKGKYQGDDFPYKRFPVYFERQAIELDLLANIPRAAKRALEADSFKKLPKSTKTALEKWLGRPVRDEYDSWRHQFGGRPWLIQGEERIVCANKQCFRNRRKLAMRVLASIINDPLGGLPMLETAEQVRASNGFFNSWVQVVFHICPNCLSIHAANRCD